MSSVKSSSGMIEAYFTETSFIIERSNRSLQEVMSQWEERFLNEKYQALYQLGFQKKQTWFSPSIDYLHEVATFFISKCTQSPSIELDREHIEIILNDEDWYQFQQKIPFVLGNEFVTKDWINCLIQELHHVFVQEVSLFEGPMSRYFLEKNEQIHLVGRVYFHLVETKEEDFPFAFMAAYSTKTSKSKRAIHTPLKQALKEFEGDQKSLLALISSVIKVSNQSAFISELFESGELFSPIRLRAKEAHTLLKEIPLYEASGILCRVPNWWKRVGTSGSISLKVGEKPPSTLGLEALLNFKPSVMIGDVQLNEDDVAKLLSLAEGLTLYKGAWIEIDHKKLALLHQAMVKLEKQGSAGLSLQEILRMEMNPKRFEQLTQNDVDVSITHGDWLRSFKQQLGNSEVAKVLPPETLQATLRQYQKEGFLWLYQLASYGLGACLADDMGLGKTVQVIALLEHFRLLGSKSALLVIPASLIGNWEHEVLKFAPKMSYQILHKSELKSKQSLSMNQDSFLYITTYTMVSKIPEILDTIWDFLIIDEAQAIKNPGSKQTKVIKSVKAKMKIAMTGTPIENHLSDLWSLYDFINQGLLGSPKEFTAFTKQLSDDPMGYARLRQVIQPFMLRRLKTDKSIISDLPQKLEVQEYTGLTKAQVVLYQKVLKQIEEKLQEAEGIERKGLILSSIMKFKQICNHPDQYLQKDGYEVDVSGKFLRLKEICEVIYEKRERVLIFTQFKEMVEPISEVLTEVFGRRGLVLHGGTPVKQRKELVEEFNGEAYVPYMVLSLKAGGVGLNLTSANHVIHFDRWWNPAVENQATDRAYRIGQMKNVVVYKFVTKGTVEEKIDEMISSKLQLSQDILGNSETQWITELSNEQLLDMFSLGGGN